jgi:uncharacterized membrane protein
MLYIPLLSSECEEERRRAAFIISLRAICWLLLAVLATMLLVVMHSLASSLALHQVASSYVLFICYWECYYVARCLAAGCRVVVANALLGASLEAAKLVVVDVVIIRCRK